MKFAHYAPHALIALGFLQSLGLIANQPILKGLGAASLASPLPIVFSDVKGLETFSSSFEAQVQTPKGLSERIEITPEVYARLGGPYNRRNVYGAAISYGPHLPEALWKSVLSYGFCRGGPLAKKFDFGEEVQSATLVLKTKTAGRNDQWKLQVRC